MLKKPFIATRELVVFPGVVTPIFIGRQASLSSLEEALSSFDNKLILSTQKDPNVEEPKLPEDVYETGVLVHVIQTVKMPNGNVKVLVEAKHRVLIGEFQEKKGVQYADYEEIFPKPVDESKSEALKRRVIDEFSNYAKITQKILPDVIYNIKEVRNIDKAFDLICTNLMIATNVKQELLEILDVEERAYKILSILEKEVEIFTLEREIENKVKEQMAEVQKNYYLREKIKAMREEMGEDSDSDEELEELDQRVQDSKIPKELKDKVVKELSRLKKMPDFSAEASVIRSYVETILELPWDKSTKDEIDIEKAEKILDEDHYGLEEVKARILELLETLKKEHMSLWNKTIEAFNNGNFEKAYGYSKKSSEQISKVLEKIDSYKCVETYNSAFDLNCDGLLDSAFEAYTMKDNFHLALKDFMENGMTEQNLQVIQTNFQGAGEDWNKLTKEIREFKNIEYYK